MRAVELYAGAGGLALAVSQAGFSHEAVIEWDRNACATLEDNKKRGVKHVRNWPIHEVDVRLFPFSGLNEGTDLIAGGPPCQPFSLAGKHQGHRDERNLFPETVHVVRQLRPRAFVFENVKGLLRPSFINYFEYVILQLSYPDLERRDGEDWESHQIRLERHHTSKRRTEAAYRVLFQKLNAADFGVPQRRDRVFIVGFRSDINANWSFEDVKQTHSHDALLWSQWITGEYWKEHHVRQPSLPADVREKVSSLGRLVAPPLTRWQTTRDAIGSLPTPSIHGAKHLHNHRLVAGARPYPGHTGSPIDEPAKTLKAGDHGVPGGENMLDLGLGRVRYFTVREAARLQTFPDAFRFSGAWSECMRQLGNAVPVKLGHAVVKSVASALKTRN
jgi:DNA (cytosine-5)-methyltransferase 1